jgi:hypothetical protein
MTLAEAIEHSAKVHAYLLDLQQAIRGEQRIPPIPPIPTQDWYTLTQNTKPATPA